MENGSVLGTYVAHAVIGLFLLVIGLVLLRTMLLVSLLLLSPARQVLAWIASALRIRGRSSPHREGPSTTGERDRDEGADAGAGSPSPESRPT